MAELAVRVNGCRNDQGHVYVALYDDPDGFPKDEDAVVYTGKGLVRAGRSTIELPDVAPGRYAAAVFHDENDDGVLNMRLKVFPKEGFGFSGKGGSRTGPPSFEDAAFDVDGDTEVDVEMNYLL